MTENEFTWPERSQSKGAWFGSPELKAWALAKMIEHRAQDEIVKGHYQQTDERTAAGYRGCWVGCTLPRRRVAGGIGPRPWYLLPGGTVARSSGNWHQDVEDLYGIRWEVAQLLDVTFEAQPWEEAALFAVASIEAIPVGMIYPEGALMDAAIHSDDYPADAAWVLEFLRAGVAA